MLGKKENLVIRLEEFSKFFAEVAEFLDRKMVDIGSCPEDDEQHYLISYDLCRNRIFILLKKQRLDDCVSILNHLPKDQWRFLQKYISGMIFCGSGSFTDIYFDEFYQDQQIIFNTKLQKHLKNIDKVLP